MCGGIISEMAVDALPEVKGRYRFDSDLSKVNWFQIGGKAEILFWPEDVTDLCNFLQQKPRELSINVIGVGSNLLVRDGGVCGCVVRLGKGFNMIQSLDVERIRVGAGALSSQLAKYACEKGLTGAEFLAGIPGTVGGAIAMNGGAYGNEFADICESVLAVDKQGKQHHFSAEEMGFSYRTQGVGQEYIFVEAVVRLSRGDQQEIQQKMHTIMMEREASQPVKTLTSGSTFRNPNPALSEGKKAWELIDAAGCRGMQMGDAMVSEKHCNFLINKGHATAQDMESLGNTVQQKVYDMFGVKLEWEIKCIGEVLEVKND